VQDCKTEHGTELRDQSRPESLLDFAFGESVKLQHNWEPRCRCAYGQMCIVWHASRDRISGTINRNV